MKIIKLKKDSLCVTGGFFNSRLLLAFNNPQKNQQRKPTAVIPKFYELNKIKLDKTSVFMPFLYILVIICKYLAYETF